MIRLTLDTIDSSTESYLDQMLFHLIQDGEGNRLVNACSKQQRKFVAAFLEYLGGQSRSDTLKRAFFHRMTFYGHMKFGLPQHEIKGDWGDMAADCHIVSRRPFILLFAAG